MKNLSIAAAAIIFSDQLTKILFTNKQYSILGFEIIKYSENTGAAFSILGGYRWLFIAVAVAALVMLLFYATRIECKRKGIQITLGILIGGILGNLIDRISLGYVRDFIDLKIWPNFNVADSAMFISVIILAIYIIKRPNNHGQKHL